MRRTTAVLVAVLLCASALARQPQPLRPLEVMPEGVRISFAWRDWPVTDDVIEHAIEALTASNRQSGTTLHAMHCLARSLRGTSGMVGISRSPLAPQAPMRLLCAIDCHDTDRADSVRSAFVEFLRQLDPAAAIETRVVDQTTVETRRLEAMGKELSIATVSNCVVIAEDDSDVDWIVRSKRLVKPTECANDHLHLGAAIPASAGFGFYVDVGFLPELLRALLDPVMPREQVAEITGVFERVGEQLQSVSVTYERPSPQRATLRISPQLASGAALCDMMKQQRPLSEADLRPIPKDAYWAQVARLDAQLVVESLLHELDQHAPNARNAISGIDASALLALGFSPISQLLPALGDTWLMYDAPDNGGLLGTGTVAIVRLRDAAAIDAMLQRGVEALTPLLQDRDVSLGFLKRRIGDRDLRTVVVGGQPVPIAPSWTIVDERLVIGLLPDSVLAAADQLDTETRGPSLVDRPEFAARFAELGERPITFAFTNSRKWRRTSGALRTHYLTALLSRYSSTSQPIEIASATSLARRLASSTDRYAAWRVDARDQLNRGPLSYLSIGDCDGFADFAVAGTWLTTVAIPLLDSSAARSYGAVARLELRRIADAIARHAAANDGQFPTEITRTLSAERATYVPGQTWADDDRNVLAYVLADDGKFAATLLLGGKIKSLSRDELDRELAATTKRLTQRSKQK